MMSLFKQWALLFALLFHGLQRGVRDVAVGRPCRTSRLWKEVSNNRGDCEATSDVAGAECSIPMPGGEVSILAGVMRTLACESHLIRSSCLFKFIQLCLCGEINVFVTLEFIHPYRPNIIFVNSLLSTAVTVELLLLLAVVRLHSQRGRANTDGCGKAQQTYTGRR